MTTIHVLTDELPGGYKPIIDFYNQNKPSEWSELRKADVSEGGFECYLPNKNLEEIKKKLYLYDMNTLVQQVRWSDGKLLSMGYIGLGYEQTQLLFKALQHILGADQVVMVNV